MALDTNTIWLALATLVAGATAPLIAFTKERKETQKKGKQIEELKDKNQAITEKLQETKNIFPEDLEVISDVFDVLNNNLLPIIYEEAAKKKIVKIENFGLDLETVMPWINNKILKSPNLEGVRFEMKALIINPESPYIKGLINGQSNISTAAINASIAAADNLKHHDLYKFSFQMKQYDLPPIFHGFLINDNQHLFLGFTEIENGKLSGGKRPYIHLRNSGKMSNITSHYFDFFKHWFDYYWEKSNEVVNVRK